MGKWRYGVILDAGSSGTRVHIYRWLNAAKARQKGDEEELQSLPVSHQEEVDEEDTPGYLYFWRQT